ncbi:MAG: malto-oligosyltrehalose trehalohydrolase [Flavisolibacter sp.]
MKLDISSRSIGVNFKNGWAEIILWSPEAQQVAIKFGNSSIALEKDGQGYWRGKTDQLQEGMLYQFVLNGDKILPDPASMSQPDGVHGPSMAIDLSGFKWADAEWKNPELKNYIIYELHTGTFTTDGSFASIEKKLAHLQELGVNAIELMPVAQFPGDRNWGYDGVYPFAVQHSYGGAAGLQQLVNACHLKGIAVVLDVVYNHQGPEGNYLGSYGPYTTDKYKTPWGGAINFDDAWSDGVRHYFIENVLMWFRDFHIDALRLDAVHAIRDFSPAHILREVSEAVDLLKIKTGRQHYLIAELDLNDTRYINPKESGGFGMDAQWVDEFHHALRVTAGGERSGYYSDFSGIVHLAKAYQDAYVYDGQFSQHRKKNFGVKTGNQGRQFIVFSQNHDQVGNRALGERSSTLVSFEMQKLMAAAVMLSPYIPMLFMGEEWSEPNPFLYFVSHTDPDLAEAVRKGRQEEFADFFNGTDLEVPDPMATETFLTSKLQWDLLTEEPHRTLFNYYKDLIAFRKTQPALFNLDRQHLHVEVKKEQQLLILQRWHEDQHLICFLNFSTKQEQTMPPSLVNDWEKIWDSASPEWKGPQSAPGRLSGGKPGNDVLVLQPASVVVYANRKEPVKFKETQGN